MKGGQFEIKEYKRFFGNINKYKELRKNKIEDGKNDYNVINALLRLSDEVRLHSRFIYSLINPDGKHYRGPYFLKMFLDIIGIKGFNYENAEVKKEFKNIDLYITDGCKHIIIENKIHAYDQEHQISRYIEIIKKSSIEEDVYDKIQVVYLTLDNRKPSKSSLGEWSIEGNYLNNGNNDVNYMNITYKTDILNWINRLLADNNVIPENIRHSIKNYQEVIQRVTRTKGSNLMTIEEYLLDDENIADLKISGEISKKFEFMRWKILYKFFNNFKDSIIDKEINLGQNISSADHFEIVKDYVYNEENCNKWFITGKAKEHYIGTFFCIDDNIQFGVMVASENLHLVLICDENIYNSLISTIDSLKENYQKRDWKAKKTFAYYSKNTSHNIFKDINKSAVLALLSDKGSNEYKRILNDIFSLVNSIKKANFVPTTLYVDTLPVDDVSLAED